MQIDRNALSVSPYVGPSQIQPALDRPVDPRVAADWLAPPPVAPLALSATTGTAAPLSASTSAAAGATSAPPLSEAENLERAQLHLELSDDVYNDTPNPPEGWRVASQDDLDRLRLTPDLLERADSSFRARVYVSDDGGDTRYVVAFRGSQTGEDWLNNGQQAFGAQSEHYDKALLIGQRLANVEANVTLTGHSLGGGMASAAALASGHDADTFNASGLHSDTISQAKGHGQTRAEPDIDAFYLKGDPLSALQDGGDRIIASGLGGIFLGGIGSLLGLAVDAPSAYGDRIALTPTPPEGDSWWGVTPLDLHGREWLKSSLEAHAQ